MRYLCVLLLACVVLTGCKPIGYRVQDNQIRVTGASGDEIGQMVARTFDSFGRVNRGTALSTNTSYINFGKNTETKRTLSAVTEEGKPLSVEILEKNNDPVLVTIHTDPSSNHRRQSISAVHPP
jgi:hypothetical protein